MSRCPYCQEELDSLEGFCPYCGADLRGESAEPSEPVTGDAPEPAMEPAKSKLRRKPVIIAIVAVVAVVAIAVGGFALYDHHRSVVYADSVALAEQGDYAAALEGFMSLGNYEDAVERVRYCEQGVAYQDAAALLESGDYEAARKAFASLGNFSDARLQVELCDAWLAYEEARKLASAGDYKGALEKADEFDDVGDVRNDTAVRAWLDDTGYRYAEEQYDAGLFYSAYEAFGNLGSYRDAPERMAACVQLMPGSGEMYHNGGYVSTSTDIVFDAGNATRPTYLKVYQGDNLVSRVFVNTGDSAMIQVPAGVYTFKKAQGDAWFGDEEMFGDDGVYRLLLFDGGNESVAIDDNKIYTITIDYQGAGNVGDRNVDSGTF